MIRRTAATAPAAGWFCAKPYRRPNKFRRLYRSFNHRKNLGRKDFGESWTYSYADEYLLKDGTGSDLVAGYVNFRDGHSAVVFVNKSSGVWEPPIGRFAHLRKNSFTGHFEIREESGIVRVYHNFDDAGTLSLDTLCHTSGRNQ